MCALHCTGIADVFSDVYGRPTKATGRDGSATHAVDSIYSF